MTPEDAISLLAIKSLVSLKNKSDYFIVTSSTSGLVCNPDIDFCDKNIWELNGNMNYYQCDHGNVFQKNQVQ